MLEEIRICLILHDQELLTVHPLQGGHTWHTTNTDNKVGILSVPNCYPSYISSIPRGSQGHKISSTNVVYITLVSVSWFFWKVFPPCPYLKPNRVISNIRKYLDSPDWLCTFMGQRPQILDLFSFHVCHLHPQILLSLSSSLCLYQKV